MKAWLTPDVSLLSDTPEVRELSVSPSLWYLVSGCLELLCDEDNWESFGTATPEDMSQYFSSVNDAFIASNP